MRLPETAEELRTAPMRALRAVFAGIGQLLVAADRFREEAEDHAADDNYDAFREWGHPAPVAPPAAAEPTAEPAAPAPAAKAPAAEAPAAKGRAAKARPEQQRQVKPAKKRPEKQTPGKPAPEKTGKPAPGKPAPGTKEHAKEETGKKEPGRPAEPRVAKSPGKSKRGAGTGGSTRRRPGASADAPGLTVEAADTSTAARSSGAMARGPAMRMGAENTMRGAKARRSRAAAEPRRFRSLDSTGNVRLLTPEDAARIAAAELATAGPATPEPTTAGPATAGPATAGPTTVEPPAAGPATLEPPAAGPADLATPAARRQTAPANLEPSAALPIAAYDALSLPSLRSRLRSLDAGQLQVLLDYERSNARRNDVMGMFERRITKLGTASSDAT